MNRSFEDILDTCIDRVTLKGDSIEQCLESYPEQAAQLEPVLRAALSVMEASSINPRPDFEKDARVRLLSALEAKAGEKGRRLVPFWGWQRRWAVAVTIILAVLLVGGGTVGASANSLPGDVLYPVKTATEKVRAFFTFGKEARASLHIDLAERRLREMESLAERNRFVPESLLNVMRLETEEAIDMLRRNEVAKRELVSRVVGLTSNQKMALARMVEKASPEAKWRFIRALRLFELTYGRAATLEETLPELERFRSILPLHGHEPAEAPSMFTY
ncbi:MAG: DUF5667 domain-containing protein [Dehalococcoidia bacterium]